MLIQNIETGILSVFSVQNNRDRGGGLEVISLWMALKYREAECIVYDISENALTLGRKLAGKLELKNIEFKGWICRSGCYEKSQKADLVMGLSAVFLQIVPDNQEGHFSCDIDPFSFRSPARDIASDFVRACSNMVSERNGLFFPGSIQ